MTTDRIQPARTAASTDRAAEQRDGSGFAALLEAHAAGEAPRPAPADAAKRVEAPAGEAQPQADTAAEALAGTGEEPTVAPQPELTPAIAEGRQGFRPVVAPAPAHLPHEALATGCAAIVVPPVVAESPPVAAAAPVVTPAPAPSLPAAGQPVAPAAVPAPPPFEATIVAPAQPATIASPVRAVDAALPAAPAPAAQTPVPVAPQVAVAAAPVEGEAAVAPAPAPVVAAPSPEPTAAAQEAPAVQPAQPALQPAAPAPQPAAGTTAPERTVPLHRAPAAVATLLHVAAERGITHAKMALRPAELGGIEIRLQATAAGIAAQVVADSPEAARLLAQAGDDLRRALEAREVTLLSLDVSTSSEERSSRESAAREWSDHGRDRTAADADSAVAAAPTTETVIELPGGLLVDVLA